jgi:hypothetical protein
VGRPGRRRGVLGAASERSSTVTSWSVEEREPVRRRIAGPRELLAPRRDQRRRRRTTGTSRSGASAAIRVHASSRSGPSIVSARTGKRRPSSNSIVASGCLAHAVCTSRGWDACSRSLVKTPLDRPANRKPRSTPGRVQREALV